MSKIDPRWHWAALITVVFVVGFWPYLQLLHNYPEGVDAMKWVTNAAPSTPGWFEWVFQERHFIGYRPVTAFSFTLNNVLTGWSPWGYRLTNAALHIGTGLMVYALFRVLTRGRGWWAVLAAAVFFAHPASETVLPHIARRSYLLGSLFSVATLVAWTTATRDRLTGVSGSMAAACLCLGAALLSNEIAYVVVPMLPIMAVFFRDRSKPWYDPLVRCIPVACVAVMMLGMRFYVLGHLGGYHKRYFAYTRNNHNMLKEVDDTPYQMVAEAAWRYMCFPTGASGEQALLLVGGSMGLMVAIGVVAYYAWRSVAEPLLPGKDDEARLVLLLFIWLAGHTLLYALTRNWFWRQSYPMLPPFALLVAMVARNTWVHQSSAYKRALHAIPQLILAASILYHASFVAGIDRIALRGQLKANDIVYQVQSSLEDEDLGDLTSPAMVYVTIPVRGPPTRDAVTWLRRLYKSKGLQFKWLTLLRQNAKDHGDRPTLTIVDHGGRKLIKLSSHMQWDHKVSKSLKLEEKSVLWLDRLNHSGVAKTYVLMADDGNSQLIEVPPPQAGGEEPPQPSDRKSKHKKKKRDGDGGKDKKKGKSSKKGGKEKGGDSQPR